MVIKELTEPECYAMLARTTIARLACAHGNQPYIVPLQVHLNGRAVYCYATMGQKIEWMRQNPLVCLELDDWLDHEQWTSVVVFGHYEELPSTPGHEGTRAMAQELFQRRAGWWEPASVPVGTQGIRSPIVFRIHIARVSGRRATPDTPLHTCGSRGVPGSSTLGWFQRLFGVTHKR
jgi:nitroimidazol reductase NimA-like FMN-containing flavoprotein (pyridoxamine 5'-phosphate oxidase superfamily)